MIRTFDDFCLWSYVLVDEVLPRIAPHCRRPGPAPRCSDPELVTLALVGQGQGWDEETVLVSHWHAHRDLFPHQPERSRFNRRRQLAGAINQVRRLLLASLPSTRSLSWSSAVHQGASAENRRPRPGPLMDVIGVGLNAVTVADALACFGHAGYF